MMGWDRVVGTGTWCAVTCLPLTACIFNDRVCQWKSGRGSRGTAHWHRETMGGHVLRGTGG